MIDFKWNDVPMRMKRQAEDARALVARAQDAMKRAGDDERDQQRATLALERAQQAVEDARMWALSFTKKRREWFKDRLRETGLLVQASRPFALDPAVLRQPHPDGIPDYKLDADKEWVVTPLEIRRSFTRFKPGNVNLADKEEKRIWTRCLTFLRGAANHGEGFVVAA